MNKPENYLFLIEQFRKLPSISAKMAEKISLFLISSDKNEIRNMLDSISSSLSKINKCQLCNAIVENDLLCNICLDKTRDSTKLCIISDFNNLFKIEKINIYDGKYFILEFNIKPNTKKFVSSEEEILEMLYNIIEKNEILEILILLDFNISGELTAYFLKNNLKKKFPNIKIYRPAVGMPINSSIDYIDEETLEESIKNKNEF
ncbi:MAG: toprim domain-containing protein [Mycoplasmoidaceae bacterium]